MMKRILVFILCSILLFCFTACDKNTGVQSVGTTTQPTKPTTEATEPPTQQTELPTESTETPTQPTEAPTTAPTEPPPTESIPDIQTSTVFNTKNVKRITLYAFYGEGKSSDVPAENLDEIIAWLNSFAVGERAPDILQPGTNTIYVEIEYSDGTVIKQGTDTITIDEVTFYLIHDAAPDCYKEILSKVSIN